MQRDVRPGQLAMRTRSLARVDRQYRNGLGGRQQRHGVVDRTGSLSGCVPSNDYTPPEIGEVPDIGDDQYRAAGDVLERLSGLVSRIACPRPQLFEKGVEQGRIVIAEMLRRFRHRQWIEA